ncbi:hypothetical protein [Celerinatantimonas sp. MCCC 1A17872]|uniref:hypothetical protein n=1 Tax=Celerinatantimonas sp. MCCC 1A17872 TaxID=3177514 RepID=UPI0038C8618D
MDRYKRMKTFQFDLILSGLRQATHNELQSLENELEKRGCQQSNPRQDKYGVRISVSVDAETFTRAMYESTQYVHHLENFKLSVRSIEFN